MTTPFLHWGDEIKPASKPTFIFPMLADSLHVDLTTYDPTGLIQSFISTVGSPFGPPNITGTDSVGVITANLYTLDTESGRLIGDPIPTEQAIAGQLGNLNVRVCVDGLALVPGVGTLFEVGNGIYAYTLDSTETQKPESSVLIRIGVVSPIISTGTYLNATYLSCRIAPEGIPVVQPTPSSITNILNAPGGPIQDLKDYINKAIRDLLGNQMTTKPTFRKDS